jgi:2-hydroxychromene-2-carboxylate isomerase
MSKVIDYYMSPISPWTYLGHARMHEIAKRHGANINVKPIDLGAVFPVSGGLPLPKRAPQRQAYRLFELKRWRDYLQVPLTIQPKFFPADSANAALIIHAAKTEGAERQMKLAGGMLKAVWAEERNLADLETLRAIAREQGLEADKLLAVLDSAKPTYEAATKEAIERQVFGVPTYIYRDEPFWGQDRLEFLDLALAKA